MTWKHFPRYLPFVKEITGVIQSSLLIQGFDASFVISINKLLHKQWSQNVLALMGCHCNDYNDIPLIYNDQ